MRKTARRKHLQKIQNVYPQIPLQPTKIKFVVKMLMTFRCLNMTDKAWPKYRALNPCTWIIFTIWIPCIIIRHLCDWIGLSWIWKYLISQVRFW